MRKIIMVLAIAVSACSGSTPYKPEGPGGGYSDFPMGGNRYSVSARGNGATSMQQVRDIVMRRAAELAIQNGDGYFIIVDTSNDTKQRTSGGVTGYSNNGTGSMYGQAYSFNNHYLTIIIELVPEEEAEQRGAINARSK